MKENKVRINQQIKAREVRLIGADGANLGVYSIENALEKTREAGLDLIEISPKSQPPVAKIMDYGKYKYEEKKKQKESKAKANVTETKIIQVKVGTGEHDLMQKAKRVAEWLSGGDRVKIDLFLAGRYKYMDRNFLQQKLEKFLQLIPEEYQVVEDVKKSPKGLTTVVESSSSKSK